MLQGKRLVAITDNNQNDYSYRMTDEEFAKLTGRSSGSRRWRSRDQSFSPTRGDPRRRSRGRSKGRGASWDRFRRRTRSGYRRSRRRSESRSPLRRSRSRSRGRRRSRGRSVERSGSKFDEFGRSREIKKKVKKTLKSRDLAGMSSRTADKLLKIDQKESNGDKDSKTAIKSEKNEPPVSKSIQSAILRNIIGDFGKDHNENKECSFPNDNGLTKAKKQTYTTFFEHYCDT